MEERMTEAKARYRGTTQYQLVFAELVTAARYRGLTTYQAVADLLGIRKPGGHMAMETGSVIGEISEDEVALGRPMLSALVVQAESHRPGPGFYSWARQLGRLQSDRPEDELPFWEQERQAVYETWKRRF
jgi:hypothetical protein